jgi:hypothetical protein
MRQDKFPLQRRTSSRVAILCGLGPADWGLRGGHHDRLVRGRYGEDVSGTFPPGCLLNQPLCSAP